MRLKEALIDWIYEPVLSFIAPAVCVSCGKPLMGNETVICRECYQKIPTLSEEYLENLKGEINTPFFDDLIIEDVVRLMISAIEARVIKKIAR